MSGDQDERVLTFEGELSLHTTASLWMELAKLLPPASAGPATVDLGAVPSCDTAGAALLQSIGPRLEGGVADVTFLGANEQVNAMLGLVAHGTERPATVAKRARHQGIIETTGEFTLEVAGNVYSTLEYIGSLVHALLMAVVRPRTVRWRDTAHYMALTGADAFGIVALVNLLMGVILAFQGVYQLGRFGLESFVPEAVAASLVPELAPLMTAIIVAGRSGAGFASEIGTMKVNQEIDALDTMGLDRIRFLVTPKMIALITMMPILVVFADVCGLAGGLLIAVTSLDMGVGTFLQRLVDTITMRSILEGFIKGECYAIVVAAVGCLRGLQARQGALGVGVATTSAVVSGIFLIICVDAVLTVLFTYAR